MAMEAAVSPDINSPPAMSSRISFSHDFIHNEPIPVEQRPNSQSPFSSSFDFDFCIRACPDQEPSSADEIFSHGKILPLQIKNKSEEPHHHDRSSSNPSPPLTRAKSLDANAEKPRLKKDPSAKEEKHKSFWHFKRSSSCGSGYTRSLCPLPLLSRSNSTGSTPSIMKKDGVSLRNNASKNNSRIPYHKPPLKKVHGNLYANGGLQVNPILNVHSGNLFGLASIFSSRTKKK